MTLRLNNNVGNNVSLDYVDNTTSDRIITFPEANGTVALEGAAGGLAGNLSHASILRLQANFGDNNATITGWERPQEQGNSQGFPVGGLVGVNANGVFSFPVTGNWLVVFNSALAMQNTNRLPGVFTQLTRNNGDTWANLGLAQAGASGPSNVTGTAASFCIFNITNLGDHRVRFLTNSFEGDTVAIGENNTNRTIALFLRIGDS